MDNSRRTSISELSDPPTADEDETNDPSKQQQHWKQNLQETSEEEECWDNIDAVTKEGKDDSNRFHLGTITATLTSTTNDCCDRDSKPSPGHNSDQLVDSGYQKSITSTAEWSPQSPLQDGMFEEQFWSSSSGGGGRSPPAVVESPFFQQSCRVEEMATSLVQEPDKSPSLQKKTCWGVGANVVVAKETVGVTYTTPPGTSVAATNGKKMRKDAKDPTGTRKKSRSKVHDLVEEDLRDLTQCLILNSLNTIPVEEPPIHQFPDLECREIFPPVQKEPQEKEDVVLLESAEPGIPAFEQIPINGDDLVLDAAHLEAAHVHHQAGLPGILLLEPLEVDVLVGPGVVENGDLANNNRDLEGNNYPDVEVEDVQDDIRRDIHDFEDNLNENIENNVDAAIAVGFPIMPHRDIHQDQLELANHHEDVANRNNVQNMPELAQQQYQQHQHEPQQLLIPALDEVDEIDAQELNAVEQQLCGLRIQPSSPPSSMDAIEVDSEPSHLKPLLLHQRDSIESPELAEVHRASREALFDSDSQIDLLDDLHIPEIAHVYEHVDDEVDDHGQRPTNIVLVGVNNYDEGVDDPFPHWLLQLLGDDGDQHDEPHFYCQGDGVEVDIEDDEQSTSSSSADTSSAENNADAAGTLLINMDEMTDQPLSLPSSSAGMLNDGLELISHLNNGHIELEVIGCAVQPRILIDHHFHPPNPPPSSVATTPLDPISPRTSLANIATTTTNLLDLNSSSSTDRDSGDEMFFDTTEDLPLITEIGITEVLREEGRLEQNLPASEIIVGGSFGCFDSTSNSSSEVESKTGYKCE